MVQSFKKKAEVVDWTPSRAFGVIELDDGKKITFRVTQCDTSEIEKGSKALVELYEDPAQGLQIQKLRFRLDPWKNLTRIQPAIASLHASGLFLEWTEADFRNSIKVHEPNEIGEKADPYPECKRTIADDRVDLALLTDVNPDDVTPKKVWAYLALDYYGLGVGERSLKERCVILEDKFVSDKSKTKSMIFWNELFAVSTQFTGVSGVTAKRTGASVLITCANPPSEVKVKLPLGYISPVGVRAYNRLLSQIGVSKRVYFQTYFERCKNIPDGTILLAYRDTNEFVSSVIGDGSLTNVSFATL